MIYPPYVLITSARNEEAYIEKTLQSVVSQTILPEKWVIVSDGSADRTDEIVVEYARKYAFIQFLRREEKVRNEGFASKVHALREGYSLLGDVAYAFIGNLDADVSFDARYFEHIIPKFLENERLGIAGGYIYERKGSEFRSRRTNTTRSVAGAIQMFRRRCFEEIGGLTPAKLGGEDWIAEIMARMRGWEVEAFPEQSVHHHKSSTGARGVLRERIRQGAVDHSLGTSPLFEMIKCMRRVSEKPYLLGALVRMSSYAVCWFRRDRRTVADEIVRFLQGEQNLRIKTYLKR